MGAYKNWNIKKGMGTKESKFLKQIDWFLSYLLTVYNFWSLHILIDNNALSYFVQPIKVIFI